ncbi:hypothetical protein BU23DRAFT_481495 [Bimuria novae-zelandiae CBS 107.79]|uniref:Aminoglycoside phosphotransferase domain-containing protein n=1 Tax=Bimuria novae-zelandiae CBS 107.79 TaxID=1447943 RepID=A0A6A5UUS0_9PLEO|nr:hypothetical protein BU23DRAFT_481495 [Bimuria novae-zelandiae CBS 107.79]
MSPKKSAHDVASNLLAPHGLHVQSVSVLQSLWAGYGEICRITATPTPSPASSKIYSYILKLITPPPTKADDEGHTRKILSYQVEQYFYTTLASQLPPHIPVAKLIASTHSPRADGSVSMAMIITDLKQTYPVAGEKRDVLTPTQVHAAIDWLSSFHGFWWPRVPTFSSQNLVCPPLQEVATSGHDARNKTVWLNGGYTYLATRRSEYANLAAAHESEWWALTSQQESSHSIAEIVASVLAPRQSGWSPTKEYMTLIHGDVKSENLFTSTSGEDVVFYDFQYTGLGLGVCDLAKLFTCSVPLSLLTEGPVPRVLTMQDGERTLLERYWERLKKESGNEYEWGVFVYHWETALVDWLRFQASWGFWGNTGWLEARVRWILKGERWKNAVMEDAQMAELWEGNEIL